MFPQRRKLQYVAIYATGARTRSFRDGRNITISQVLSNVIHRFQQISALFLQVPLFRPATPGHHLWQGP